MLKAEELPLSSLIKTINFNDIFFIKLDGIS